MTWKQVVTVGTVMVGGFLYLIYKSQEKILYLNEQIPPKRTSENPTPYKNPGQHYMNYEDVWLTTSDNLKLHAWYIPAPRHRDDITTYSYSQSVIHKPDSQSYIEPMPSVSQIDPNNNNDNNNSIISDTSVPTIIWFHANAGNMGFRLPNLLKMHKELECNLFILSYRGYGESEGEPNEDGIKIDAVTAMEYILKRARSSDNYNEIDINKIFIFGRSLGGAVASYVASKYDKEVAGLILENTFLSISDMVGKVFPFLNFDIVKQYMLRIHWRTVDLIPNINCPILFLASEKDEIVPHNQMIELHENANESSYKLMYKIKDGMHNDAWLDEKGGVKYWKTMKSWMQEAIAIKEIQLRKEQKSQNNNNNNNNDNNNGNNNDNGNDNDGDAIKSEL